MYEIELDKETNLNLKKITMKAWADELLRLNEIDAQKYKQMVSLIEKIKH